jgi:sugar lactone lactonase YvrE
MEWKAELALDAKADLGEGPVWDGAKQRLLWVDINEGLVRSFEPGSGRTAQWQVGEKVGAAVLRRDGGIMVARESGFATLDLETGEVAAVAGYEGACPEVRMNDGKCDPVGRFWAGTMAYDLKSPVAALYRLDAGGRVMKMVDGVICSNGLDWTADGRGMYYIDTLTGRIDWFDFDMETGQISGRRPFVQIEEGVGYADGMTLDAEGNVWVALWGGHAVRCYSPQGKLEGVVRVAATQTSSCAFGGEDLKDLYITSARTGLGENVPEEGGLFVVRPGVAGRRAFEFAG